jgi:hypothetical protein
MQSYEKIYFNHIPKTGGRFFNEILNSTDQIKTYFVQDDEDLSLELLNKYDAITGHLGTYPNILFNNIKTCTLIRDPVSRLISHYSHAYRRSDKTQDEVLSHFDRWIFNDDEDIFIKSNFQSKCLTNSVLPKINKLPIDKTNFIKDGFRYIKKDTNYVDAKNYLDMCNLVVTSTNIEHNKIWNHPNTLSNILKFLNISNISDTRITDILNAEWDKYKNPMSKFILHNLSKLQISKIEELNSIDIEIFEYAQTLS